MTLRYISQPQLYIAVGLAYVTSETLVASHNCTLNYPHRHPPSTYTPQEPPQDSPFTAHQSSWTPTLPTPANTPSTPLTGNAIFPWTQSLNQPKVSPSWSQTCNINTPYVQYIFQPSHRHTPHVHVPTTMSLLAPLVRIIAHTRFNSRSLS